MTVDPRATTGFAGDPPAFAPPLTAGSDGSDSTRAGSKPADSTLDESTTSDPTPKVDAGTETTAAAPDGSTRPSAQAASGSDVPRAPFAPSPGLGGCPLFPADSYWRADVRQLAVHSRSPAWVSAVGTTRRVHADFGSGLWAGGPIGIPYTLVPGSQPRVAMSFTYASESDPGPYPIPVGAPIEGGPAATGDRHVLVVETGSCTLFESFAAYPQPNGSWRAGSGAVFSLNSNAFRPAGWTSADAAGLPILPGLVRYDEVATGRIDHALRITVPRTQSASVWPARHQAGSTTDANVPPMGAWVRLKANVDPTRFTGSARVVVETLQRHGGIVADNGSAWYVSGAPDERWNNDNLHQLDVLTGANFEFVDTAPLVADPNSGRRACC